MNTADGQNRIVAGALYDPPVFMGSGLRLRRPGNDRNGGPAPRFGAGLNWDHRSIYSSGDNDTAPMLSGMR
jgi:hypothetical protein